MRRQRWVLFIHLNLILLITKGFGQEHVKVQYEENKYAGWPANSGMWSWENEILVGYTYSNHRKIEGDGHAYDREVSMAKFSRSLDGGRTWKMEDAYVHGITEGTWEHHLGEKSISGRKLTKRIDFQNVNFAMNFRMRHETAGGTSFYYTYDRGRHWEGPFELQVNFSGPKSVGIVSRTDYIVDGKHSMTALITVAFDNGARNWRQVACVRTDDGGISWKQLSWIGPEGVNSIMPSTIRLSKNKLLTIIRRTKPAAMVSYLSEDNGSTWRQLKDPVQVDANGHPPALVQLASGKLCLVYGIREAATMDSGIGMYVTYSSDQGITWSTPDLLRGKDGARWDIGYPKAIVRPDGKVVATYYYNQASSGDPFRYIAATLFDPETSKK